MKKLLTALGFVIMFSGLQGCVNYYRDEKTESFTSFLQKSSVQGLRVNKSLSVKSADSQGDVEMFRAIFEAGKQAGKAAAGVP